jgi:hypothetical protein
MEGFRDIGDSCFVERQQASKRKRRSKAMFQLILALTFIGMILTPAIVAAKSGKKEFDPEMEDAAQESNPEVTALKAAPAKRTAVAAAKVQRNAHDVPTLPLHGTLGLAGR